MSASAGINTRVYVDGYDLSCYLTEASVTASADLLDTSTLCHTARTRIAGLKDASLSYTGLFEGTAGTADAVFRAIFGVPTQHHMVTIGGASVGDAAIALIASESEYSIDSPVDGLVGVTASASGDGALEYGTILHAFEAETATGDETAVNNLSSSASGGAAWLQVGAFTGITSIDVIVEGSATGAFTGEETTVATFTQVTAAQVSERVAVSGTVPQYLRASWTVAGTGSATFIVCFNRA